MSAQPHMSDFEDGIPSYLSRLTQSPLLTAEEEVLLTKAIQNGDECARRRLIESNMRLVINIAKTYRNRAIPLEDLIQEGAIGLMQAAERFDPDKGFRFSTYATHWIRQAIGRAIDNKSKAIRLPAHVSQSLRKIEKERGRLVRENGCEPSTEQLATAIGISPKKLLTLMQTSQELLSLDMTVGDSGGTTLGGLLRDTSNADPERMMLSEEIVAELQRILLELNEREQRVMRLRFRLDEGDGELGDDIAKEMKLSRERVRQIEVQAIKKLRHIAQKRRLRDILS
ncbi:MAG TPA: RNA polymerase sigma factor RpoD/SigA [Fimbriimonas sp.]|nr:RNA polymerase sigma factor RpoD/SigA [Fimbriimonas sp.]